MTVIRQNSASDVQRMVAQKHVVQRQTHRVDIYLFVVTLARDLLRSHVKHSTDLLLVSLLQAHSVRSREPKVNDLKLVLVLDS